MRWRRPGAKVHLAHPLGVKAFSHRRVKNDELDARDLADLLRMGRLPEAWIAPPEIRELREITRYRCKLVHIRTRCKDQVQGVLAKLGIEVTCSDIFGAWGTQWLDELPLPQPCSWKVASLRQLIGWLTSEITVLEQVTAKLLAGHDGYRAVQELPGIGPVLGGVIVAEIGDSQRWDLVTRLLHDDSIPVTDRVAGCLVLLFGQNMTRVAAMTTSQVTRHGDNVYVQLGQHEIPVPSALGSLLLTLIADGKPNTGTGSPAVSQWLFPGLLPGQPITPARLAGRLRALGIPVQAGRRAALTGLAAQLPAAVLADTLGLQPATAVRWMHDAGADWNRYAASLARTRNHQPGE